MIGKLIDKILEWIFKRLPDCRETAFDISRAMDERAGFRKRFQTKLHLLMCAACRNYLKQIRFIQSIIRRSDPNNEPPACDLSVEAKQRLKSAVLLALQ